MATVLVISLMKTMFESVCTASELTNITRFSLKLIHRSFIYDGIHSTVKSFSNSQVFI